MSSPLLESIQTAERRKARHVPLLLVAQVKNRAKAGDRGCVIELTLGAEKEVGSG
jgi:hypothetical protein